MNPSRLACATLSGLAFTAWVVHAAPPADRVHAHLATATAAPGGTAPMAPSEGCVSCHKTSRDPHPAGTRSSCVDCHGGDGTATTIEQAHPKPRHPEEWHGSGNPHSSFTLLNRESPEWVRFVNPSDLRVAEVACGRCHAAIVNTVRKSSMVNSAQVYGSALYNNGTIPYKEPLFVEQYTTASQAQAIRTIPPPTAEETRLKGIVPILFPLPRFEIGQPGTFFRIFERGGGPKSELGNPNREDAPGQPDVFLSNRGLGTQAAVDPVILGAQKIRLNDPVMSFLGTNDAPGDFRTSGCGSCHIVYANDRDKFNSGPYATHGNRGFSADTDPTIPKDKGGHPIRHQFTRSIPSSQCITCHVHNGNGFLNSYLGYMWWDEQTAGEHLYPKQQKNPTEAELDKAGRFNPEEAAARGLWSSIPFLETLSEKNPQIRGAQFSDYHGHGWVFTRVYKKDRKGRYLDAEGTVIDYADPRLFDKAVHLKDIHLERGMHCVDCHFGQDNHGSGKLYGDRRAAIEIDCVDCHGTSAAAATLTLSGPAATGTDLTQLTTPWGAPRFDRRRGKVTQRSMVEEDRSWTVPQVIDSVTAGHERYNERSAWAKTVQRDGKTWGDGAAAPAALAHSNEKLTCYACHSSWVTNCFGCHLSARVNTKKPMLHNEGDETQVYASYNPQVLRSDAIMLAIDGTVFKHRVVPARSSSSVVLSVENANREQVVSHGQTISAAGYNGNAFNTFVPHTVRGKETLQCSDCHVSERNDNNAWLASALLLGSNQVNFMGRYLWVAEGGAGFQAVAATEKREPQAVYGSHLHSLAYPDDFKGFVEAGRTLSESRHHGGRAQQVQLYGEWLLVAGDGFRVYDVSQVANKGFSQGIVSAPFRNQVMKVATREATGLAVGSPQPLDVKRKVLAINEERPVSPIFGHAFVSDRVEGLVVVDVTTLSDGVPTNNAVSRVATYNPEGRLSGASSIALVGSYAYLTTPGGVEVVDVADPMQPRHVASVGEGLKQPTRVAAQFRYVFVTDADGLKVLDATHLDRPRLVAGATVPIAGARSLYLARTYAYVAAGAGGVAVVDIEQPEKPFLDQTIGAPSVVDAHDVKVGSINAGTFLYVADGRDGIKVIELISPETVPGHAGYSPRPAPRLASRFATRGPALGLSEGLRRDRGVDESGNQIAVMGRRGARPFDFREQRRMYLRDGKLYTVADDPPRPRQAAN
jgi:hypothetical protein